MLTTLVFAGTAAVGPAPKAAPQPSFNTPANFPPDYRNRVAAMLVKAYLQERKGRPQISEVQGRPGLIGASSVFAGTARPM
jgi:hypothetical protein